MSKNANVVATGQAIPAGNGTVSGIIVCSHTSGTLKLNDSPNAAAGRVILDTYTFPSGSSSIIFPKPLDFYEGVFATIGGTNVSIELVWSPAMKE